MVSTWASPRTSMIRRVWHFKEHIVVFNPNIHEIRNACWYEQVHNNCVTNMCITVQGKTYIKSHHRIKHVCHYVVHTCFPYMFSYTFSYMFSYMCSPSQDAIRSLEFAVGYNTPWRGALIRSPQLQQVNASLSSL